MPEEGETSELFVARKYGRPETKKVGEGKKEGSLAERTMDLLDSNLTDPEGKEVYQRIKDNRESDPDSSLFHLIQEELRDLEHQPQPEIESALRRGRHILIREAKEHGIFESMKGYLHEAQASNDYGRAMEVIKKMNVRNLEDEARGVRGWSQDFGGMLDEYKDVALINMRLAELRAGGLGDLAQAKGLERKIDLRGWGQPPQGLESMALDYLMGQERVGPSEEARLQPQLTEEGIARAMGVASAEELKELYRRAGEVMVALPSVELQLPKFLVGAEQRERIEWTASVKLTSACAFKREARFHEMHPNNEAQSISDQEFEALLYKEGVLEAVSLTSLVIVGERDEKGRLKREVNPRELLMPERDAPSKEDVEGRKRWQEVRTKCPKSIFDVRDGSHLDAYRKAISYWLRKNRGIEEEKIADEAITVAWNLSYLANMLEYYDSRYFYPDRNRASPIPQLKSLNAWMMLHPQERFESKLRDDEAWGPFGAWALKRRGRKKEWQPPELLPRHLFENGFSFMKDGHGKTFLKTFLQNGKDLAGNPQKRRGDLGKPYFGGKKREGTYSGYQFLRISDAITVFSAINSVKHEGHWRDLSNSLRVLKVNKKYRQNLLLGLFGVNPKKKKLSPMGGSIKFRGYKQGVSANDPSFFD